MTISFRKSLRHEKMSEGKQADYMIIIIAIVILAFSVLYGGSRADEVLEEIDISRRRVVDEIYLMGIFAGVGIVMLSMPINNMIARWKDEARDDE